MPIRPRSCAATWSTSCPRWSTAQRRYGPVVVFHSAVIAYLPVHRREVFHDLMTDLVAAGRCHWVSNEGGRVLPRITGSPPMPAELRGFVLGIDGRAVAWTHGHGRWLTWL